METLPSSSTTSEKQNGHPKNGYSFANNLEALHLSEDSKVTMVSSHFAGIMKIMGLDLNEPGLKDTPRRIARMYVKDLFKGLNPSAQPAITSFADKNSYNKLVIQKNITVHSICERYLLPIIGKAHVAYISNGRSIGLSKLNRIVEYHSKKPQMQERLTEEIADSVKEALKIQDVAVLIDAAHLSVTMRGVNDTASSTVTSYFGGKFQNEDIKTEFLLSIKSF
jgi:GTP cyclohydrolase IA